MCAWHVCTCAKHAKDLRIQGMRMFFQLPTIALFRTAGQRENEKKSILCLGPKCGATPGNLLCQPTTNTSYVSSRQTNANAMECLVKGATSNQ
ncbi:hypothetical protein AWZ03_010667 [Drosophila navojoa]|uniref:Uncharacterized protein n=1 Tax=Drosophila navojoa TaxID=7232 RepID=A0A484B286_DRONA|nr:hypothetical protein AWZ03_010667 [Drosophila navojoa]